MHKQTYDGNSLYNQTNDQKINFGLYGLDDIKFNASKSNIAKAFKLCYANLIKEALESINLKYHGMKYYSPTYYNYSTDSLDLVISMPKNWDAKKYFQFIDTNAEQVKEHLEANTSYDGYMAMTKDSIADEKESYLHDPLTFTPDIIILSFYLNSLIDFSDFEASEFIEFLKN